MTSRGWLLGLALALAGCASSHAGEPAWPKLHATADDGGESLAPHASTQTAEAAATDDQPAAAAAAAVVPAAGSAAAPAAAAPQTIVAPVDEITTDEMTIEVDE